MYEFALVCVGVVLSVIGYKCGQALNDLNDYWTYLRQLERAITAREQGQQAVLVKKPEARTLPNVSPRPATLFPLEARRNGHTNGNGYKANGEWPTGA